MDSYCKFSFISLLWKLFNWLASFSHSSNAEAMIQNFGQWQHKPLLFGKDSLFLLLKI